MKLLVWKRFGFAVVLMLALVGGVNADAYDDGIAAYRLWRSLAEQGHASAQVNLGSMYGNGQGVPQDDAKAMRWFRKAAEQGHAGAQVNLGLMYGNGQGVPQDTEAGWTTDTVVTRYTKLSTMLPYLLVVMGRYL